MRRGYVLHGAAAVAAVVLAVVVALVLRLRTELADAVPRTALTIADAAEEAASRPAGGDASSSVAVETAPAAACESSESATMRATRPRPLRLSGASARELLLVSRDAEHLAAAALLSRNARERIDDITRALVTGRQNVVIAWTAVQICAAAGDVPCPAQEWEEQLLKLDGQNSEVWIQVAARRLERGDARGALDAVQRAASAPASNAYWPDTVEMLERGLAAAGGYSFSERTAIAFAVAAANQPDYASYLSLCKAQSEANRAWADACLHYGQVAEVQRRTVLGQTSARTLQIAILEVVADEESIAQVRARGRQTVVTTAERRRADALIVSGPRPFARYLAKLRESGESAAVAFMLEDAASLATPPPTAECRQLTSRD